MTSAVALVLAAAVPAAAVAAPVKPVASKSVKKPAGKKVTAKKPAASKTAATKKTAKKKPVKAPAPVIAPQQATVVQVVPAPPAPPPLPAWQPVEADYRWIDDGYALLDAIGDAPPDFAFTYAGGDAWGWRTRTGHEVYAEPLYDRSGRQAGLRYYYFDPRANAPFLVQDGPLAFGFADGRMVMVYDRDGRVLAPGERDGYWSLAGLLHSRGRAIRDAARYQDRWDAADAGWWAGQVPSVIQLRLRWDDGRSRQPGWSRWRERPDSLGRRRELERERDARWASGQRFHRWRQDGFRGPVPQFGTGVSGQPAKGVRPPQQGWRPGAGRPQGAQPAPGGSAGAAQPPPGTNGATPTPGAGTRPDRFGAPGMGVARPNGPWTRPADGTPIGRPGRVPPFAGQPVPDPVPQQDSPAADPRPDRTPRPDGAGSGGRRDGWQRPDRGGAPQPPVPTAPETPPATPPPATLPPVVDTPAASPEPPRQPRPRPGRPEWDGSPRDSAPEPTPLPAEVEVAPAPPAPPPPPPEPVYTPPAPSPQLRERGGDGLGRRGWQGQPREAAPEPAPAPAEAYIAPPPPPAPAYAPPPPPPPAPPPPPPPPPPPERQQIEVEAPQ
jgi:hypothetical protein